MSRSLSASLAAQLEVFRGVSDRRISAVARGARVLELRPGEALVRRGEPLPGLCAVASGSLKLSMSAPGRNERVLRLVPAGETFGESATLRAAPSPFDALAVAPSRVLCIPLETIETLMEEDRRFARNLIDRLAEQGVRLARGMQAEILQRAPQRLAAYLCSLAPADEGADARIRLPVSKTLVAALLGVKKETLSRLLRDFAERGLIAVARREITILDRAGLEALE
jgi:CRP-like cAMP-binding protein